MFMCCQKDKKEEKGLPVEQFRSGDIVFRRGTGIMSRTVLAADDRGGAYSHVGILVRGQRKWKVVHAVPGEPDFEGDPDRVKMEDISLFFAPEKALCGGVMRLKKESDSLKACRASEYATDIYRRHTLFDHAYVREDTTRMYCTELVEFVYRKVGIDLVEERVSRIRVPCFAGDYVFPSALQESSCLKLVYSF